MKSTTKMYPQIVWQAVQELDAVDITIKVFGNVGSLLARFQNVALPVEIYQNGTEFLVFDPDGKDQQHFDLEVLHEPEFQLSEPIIQSMFADRHMALGRLHVKRSHKSIKRPLVLCDQCGKLINRYTERYVYRTLYADPTDPCSSLGKVFFHAEYMCVKRHLLIPSATTKSHTRPL